VTLVLAVVFIVSSGFARRLAGNTIDPVASLHENGRRITLTGPIRCTQVEWVALRVTVTQRSTGAIAEGYAILLGSTDVQHWQLHASVRGSATFEAGAATAVAVAVSTREGEATDAHQWLVPVTLEN
jgi:hypothetical protein